MRNLSLSPEIKLLLDLLESRRPVLSGAAAEHHRQEVENLRLSHLVKAEGHGGAIESPDARLVNLHWSPENGGYGYFDESDGWVPATSDKVTSFTVDIVRFLTILTCKLALSRAPQVTIKDTLWDLGSRRIGSHTKKTAFWFARRVNQRDVLMAVADALRANATEVRRVLFTSADSDLIHCELPRTTVISLRDVVRGRSLAIEIEAVVAQLDGSPQQPDEPIAIFAEGREVRFKGRTYRFTRGVKQRQIIMLLHRHYLDGVLWVSSDEIVEALDLGLMARIRDIFKGNRAWGTLLTEKNGMCGFCWK